jgi:hypothetical protein
MTLRGTDLLLLASVSILPAACSRPATTVPAKPTVRIGGDYGPVPRRQLLGEQVCRATGASGEKFCWTFHEDRFEVRPDGAPIPREVLDTLLGKDAEAQLIEGKWELVDRTLQLSEVLADGKVKYPDVQLRPFRTPVVRMYFGKTQYVLGPKQPRPPAIRDKEDAATLD